ncbi:MAG: hypothetical protein ACRC1K_19680, partial [Planctomycetia bacterium]
GDRSFQDKARGRMREMMSKAKLIVIVSHDLSVLPTLCEKVIWMERGTIREMGDPEEIINNYKMHVGELQTVGGQTSLARAA